MHKNDCQKEPFLDNALQKSATKRDLAPEKDHAHPQRSRHSSNSAKGSAARKRRRADIKRSQLTMPLYHKIHIKSIEKQQKLSF